MPGEHERTDTEHSGAMFVERDGQKIPMPLKHTDVVVDITGYVSQVRVIQTFHNPFDEKIEAVYVFPLPQDAAVDEFVMTIGDRKIRGIIRPREEAERMYEQAKSQGYRAALLTQQRPNIFTQRVANIEPGEQIEVNIRYFHTLAYRDGQYVFAFPMVVGPRFTPASATAPPQPRYLRPGQRNGHNITLTVHLDPGTTLESLKSVHHPITRTNAGRTIRLATNNAIANKDFVLRFGVEGDRMKQALLTHRDKRGGFFTLMLHPPSERTSLEDRPQQPLEMIFVLDCSGSMSGRPIEQAKAAIKLALRELGPNDTFQIVRFSTDASSLGDQPILATPDNIRHGLRYLKKLKGSGGTMMIEGIKTALGFSHDERRLRFVCFMTDGFIGNEADILKAIHERIGESRIFSFGVGSSPNRFFLSRMAEMGRGVTAYLSLEEDPRPIMANFLRRVRRPVLTDITLDFGDMQPMAMYPRPRNIPDLFVGRPVTITGRFAGDLPDRVTVRGRVEGQPVQFVIETNEQDTTTNHEAIASLWARHHIRKPVNEQISRGDQDCELADSIQRIALDYNLMSAYTAFVAIDASQRTSGSHGTTVYQAVPVPDGVRYETTVGN